MRKKGLSMYQTQKLTYLFDSLYAVNNICFWHYTKDWELLDTNCPWINEVRNFFFDSKDDALKTYASNSTMPILYPDRLCLTWAIQPYIVDDNLASFYVLGPFLNSSVSEINFKRLLDDWHMSISSQHRMMEVQKEIPVIPYSLFLQSVRMLYYTLYGKTPGNLTTTSFPTLNPLSSKNTLAPPKKNGSTAHDITITEHSSYAMECAMLKHVETGNIHYQDELQNTELSADNYLIGLMSPGDIVRQEKDEIIVFVALITRAAIRGGMDPDEAYSLSDYYIQQIESPDCTDLNNIMDIHFLAYDTFIHRVHEIQLQGKEYSPFVNDCIALIHRNIYEKITLEDLAEALGYSTYYLSSQFKKQTGQSIGDYMTDLRIEKAKEMLTYNNISLTDLSAKLHFSTPSYFSSVFKKRTGLPPSAYVQSLSKPASSSQP